MDNLSLQLHPLEVNHLPPFPGQLSCLLKKIAISTGHTLQKHTLLGVEGGQGTVKFPHGPTLSLSKEFELSNTKLSLHFMSKQARTVSCIGSAEIDLGCLPQQPVVRYACPLTNSTHPQASLLVELKRNESRVPPKVARKKPEEMNILFTESQLKEELITCRRRKDPNIPTAYEISRKNYKQSQIFREDPSRNSRSRTRNPQPSSSRPSPSKILTPSHQRSATSYNQRYGGRTKPNVICEDSPIPREKTPEPIGPTVPRKHKEEEESTWGLKQEGSGESHEQPSRLQVRPYQECSSVNSDRACFESAVREHWEGEPQGQYLSKESSEFSMKQDKYLDITEKLQTIQDQLMGFQAKRFKADSAQREKHQQEELKEHRFMEQREQPPTQSDPSTNTTNPHSYSQLNNNSSPTIQQPRQFPLPSQLGEAEEPTTFRQQFSPFKQESPSREQEYPCEKQEQPSKKQQVPPLKKESFQVQPGRQVEGQTLKGQQLRRRFDQQLSFLESQNQQLSKQNELLKVNSLEAETTLRKLMGQLEEEVRIKGEKQDEIDTLKRVNLEQEKEMARQRKLLDKMGLQYEDKLDELTLLQQQLANRQQPQGEPKEETEWKKRTLEAEGSLRIRENQIRHLKLEMDNLRGEKRQLEMEVQALASNDRQEMGRQKSLAHIQQVSSNSLVSITQRENETLRAEVAILQNKLTSLNLMLEGVLERGSPGRERRVEVETVDRNRECQERTKLLELRCSALEEELRVKKSLMAEMVNLIWSQGDASLMQRTQKLMDEQGTN